MYFLQIGEHLSNIDQHVAQTIARLHSLALRQTCTASTRQQSVRAVLGVDGHDERRPHLLRSLHDCGDAADMQTRRRSNTAQAILSRMDCPPCPLNLLNRRMPHTICVRSCVREHHRHAHNTCAWLNPHLELLVFLALREGDKGGQLGCWKHTLKRSCRQTSASVEGISSCMMWDTSGLANDSEVRGVAQTRPQHHRGHQCAVERCSGVGKGR